MLGMFLCQIHVVIFLILL